MAAVVLVLVAASVSIVLTHGSIFQFFREHGPTLWRDLLSCPLCAGVWIGAGAHVLMTGISGPWTLLRAATVLGVGCATGVTASFLSHLLDRIGDDEAETQRIRSKKISDLERTAELQDKIVSREGDVDRVAAAAESVSQGKGSGS